MTPLLGIAYSNVDPPPLPAWDKSNEHKLKEPLETIWNNSLLGVRVGGV